jgi:hypothetical protein
MKKTVILLMVLLAGALNGFSQRVVISSNPNDTGCASAAFEVKSTSKGFLPPRMTEAQRNAINSPTEGLLVYQTDGAKGMYYYKDTSWTGLEPGSVAVKTANATLQKNETFVLASNDIMLTLPQVTAVDNGLAITIKNNGTVTDLVTVLPFGTAVIDSLHYVPLLRWYSVTFIAKDGNWYVKERTSFSTSTIDVSWASSFRTISEALQFLNDHMSAPTIIRMGNGDFNISETQVINLPYPLTIESESFGNTTLKAASGLAGKPMFTCASECYFKMLVFDGSSLSGYGNSSGEDAIQLTGSGVYHEIKDCSFEHFNKTINIKNNIELWLFENDISDAVASGVEVDAGNASGAFIKMSETDFLGCLKSINLQSGTAARVSVLNCGHYCNSSNAIAINYVPATFTQIENIYVANNTWNHEGTFINGFDFSRSDGRDRNAIFVSNVGDENQTPHCKVNAIGNTTSYSCSTSWIKANWNSSVQTNITNKFTIATNKITYQPTNQSDLVMWISGNIICNSAQNRVVNIAIVKNGVSTVRYGQTSIRVETQSQPFQWSTVAYIPDANPNDYYEIWTSMGSNTETLTLQDVNWFTNSQ